MKLGLELRAGRHGWIRTLPHVMKPLRRIAHAVGDLFYQGVGDLDPRELLGLHGLIETLNDAWPYRLFNKNQL